MTYDHNYTTHQEQQSSEREIYLCMILCWRREVQNFSILLSGGYAIFEAWENWGVTVPAFLMESDVMRCLSSKSMYVGVLCTISEEKRKLKIVLLEKQRSKKFSDALHFLLQT